MSIRFLPAALLPSRDKVVSSPAAARCWAIQVSEALQNTNTHPTHTAAKSIMHFHICIYGIPLCLVNAMMNMYCIYDVHTF